jgi:hypothetical protein
MGRGDDISRAGFSRQFQHRERIIKRFGPVIDAKHYVAMDIYQCASTKAFKSQGKNRKKRPATASAGA